MVTPAETPQELQETASTTTSPIGDVVFEGIPVVSDDRELKRRGICRVKISKTLDCDRWADELSQVTPMNLAFEGDGEYAFYRNILDEPEFPFEQILFANEIDDKEDGLSEIGRTVLQNFPVLSEKEQSLDAASLSKELRLDDAFCVHYNMDQDDTSGAKHMDPSDITINMCLHKAKDTRGSYVLFYGTKQLLQGGTTAATGSTDKPTTTTPSSNNLSTEDEDRFLVPQIPGYATIHFGDHFHETTPLRRGSRTNIILTYLYTDTTRSDASTRNCY